MQPFNPLEFLIQSTSLFLFCFPHRVRYPWTYPHRTFTNTWYSSISVATSLKHRPTFLKLLFSSISVTSWLNAKSLLSSFRMINRWVFQTTLTKSCLLLHHRDMANISYFISGKLWHCFNVFISTKVQTRLKAGQSPRGRYLINLLHSGLESKHQKRANNHSYQKQLYMLIIKLHI